MKKKWVDTIFCENVILLASYFVTRKKMVAFFFNAFPRIEFVARFFFLSQNMLACKHFLRQKKPCDKPNARKNYFASKILRAFKKMRPFFCD